MCDNSSHRKVAAAILRKTNGPFELATVNLGQPRPHEVLVRIVATGLCHTDLAVRDGVLPTPVPAVLGHEGAGIVVEVGSDVRTVGIDDHVVLTFLPCGECRECFSGTPSACGEVARLNFGGCRADGSHALVSEDETFSDRFFGQSSFATYAIADERNVVPVRKDAPLEYLGPLGCGIQTGAGTVLNALEVGPGASLAVFGGGAVGLSAAMAAKFAGATSVFVIDIVPSRLELARELGATAVFDGRDSDLVARIRDASNGGVEFSLDTTGVPKITRNAVDVLRPLGTCAFVGATPLGTELTLDTNDVMNNNKRLMGVIEGRSVPRLFIPKLVDLFMQGRFPFDRLVRFYDFADINQAVQDSEAGNTIKPILMMDT